MTRAEEYRLSQYQHLGALREDKSIDLVRNQQTGLIGVQKVISSELYVLLYMALFVAAVMIAMILEGLF